MRAWPCETKIVKKKRKKKVVFNTKNMFFDR